MFEFEDGHTIYDYSKWTMVTHSALHGFRSKDNVANKLDKRLTLR